MPVYPPKRGYKRGRKKGFTFGRPVPKKPIVVHDEQFARAAKITVLYDTPAEILRQAIDLGLPILERQHAEFMVRRKMLIGNPADWEQSLCNCKHL